MASEIFQSLQSPDPAQRRDAIIALVIRKDRIAPAKIPMVLDLLAEVAQNDPETELRELASEAIQFVRIFAGSRSDSAAQPDPEPVSMKPLALDEDSQRAAQYLDAATDYHLQGNRVKAIEILSKALELDPTLPEIPFAQNVIAQIVGRSVEEALPVIMEPERRAAFIASLGDASKRKKAGGKSRETPEKREDRGEFLSYVVVSLAMVAGMFLCMAQPVWLAPPEGIRYTAWAYLCLGFAWIPMLIGCVVLRIIRLRVSLLTIFTGMLVLIIIFAVMPIDSEGKLNILVALESEPVCDSEYMGPEGRIRYTCVISESSYLVYYYKCTFEETKDSRFVRVISCRDID